MTTCFGKSYSFGLLCMPFVNVYEFVCVLLSPFGFERGMWDLIVLIYDHCLSIFLNDILLNGSLGSSNYSVLISRTESGVSFCMITT